MIEVIVSELKIDESYWQKSQILILKEKNGERTLPIYIGFFEAQSIYLRLNRIISPRPFSHDLMLGIITRLGGQLVKIFIDELKSDTFHAKLYIQLEDGTESIIDSRPSDAVAIALRAEVPIYVNDDIMNKINKEEE